MKEYKFDLMQEPVGSPSLFPSPSFSSPNSQAITWQSLQVHYKLGSGAYGHVFMASYNLKEYAVKQMSKHKLKRHQAQHMPLIERQILKNVDHPGIAQSEFFFQTHSKLYIGMEHCEGGHLQELVRSARMSQQARRFYFAQLVNTVEYLHSNGIVHRDLKPSNLMLGRNRHLKMIDFGTASIQNCPLIPQAFKQKLCGLKKSYSNEQEDSEDMSLRGSNSSMSSASNSSPRRLQVERGPPSCVTIKQRKSSFVGTSYYVAPELIERDQCGAPADLWALGCILYFLYYEHSPFADICEYTVYQKIKTAQIVFVSNPDLSKEAQDLISRLLVKNPADRLGSCSREQTSFESLKRHPYFDSLQVDHIYEKDPPKVMTQCDQLSVRLTEAQKWLQQQTNKEKQEVQFMALRHSQQLLAVCLVKLRPDSLQVHQLCGNTILANGDTFWMLASSKGQKAYKLTQTKFLVRTGHESKLIFSNNSQEETNSIVETINQMYHQQRQAPEPRQDKKDSQREDEKLLPEFKRLLVTEALQQ